jgi:pre-mRNA-processing factor 40
MSDSDRQLYFADFVLELQAAEDEKRRRIRDARRRAETAQREAYRERIQEMAAQGRIVPSSRWRSVESLLQGEATYGPVHTQDPEAPREIFEDFVEEWDEVYRRDRATMSKLVYSPSRATSYEEFTKALLDEAAHSPELYAEIRKCVSREEPVASAFVYFNELIQRARESVAVRRASAQSSSEDEGEIREDGEVSDEGDEG